MYIIVAVVLICLLLAGGFGGVYHQNYGFGGMGLVLIVLLILYLTGRL